MLHQDINTLGMWFFLKSVQTEVNPEINPEVNPEVNPEINQEIISEVNRGNVLGLTKGGPEVDWKWTRPKVL